MAAEIHWGYRYGPSRVQTMKVAGDGTVIKIGDLVKVTGGYIAPATDSDTPIGVALAAASNAASSPDGVQSIPVETSCAAIYEYPLASGTVSQTLVGLRRNIVDAQSINPDSTMSAVACIWMINVARNTVECSFNFENAFTV